MSLIIDTIQSYIPANRRNTSGGWISFNAPCCIHNGETQDTKGRGGIHIDGDSVSYHCFNCGFKASWQPGWLLSYKFKNLLSWLNVPDDLITKCSFEGMKLKDMNSDSSIQELLLPTFLPDSMPNNAKPITEWIKNPPNALIPVLEYLASRDMYLDDYNWYWSDDIAWRNRLLIPYYYYGKIVGYTGRLINSDDDRKKYLSSKQPGYVFNIDHQHKREFMVVCEGQLDAICVDGVAVMSTEITPQQRLLIERQHIMPVVVPDRDHSSIKLAKQVSELDNWAISYPEWPDDVKDINDAVKRFGRLYTLYTIANSIQETKLKKQLGLKRWFKGVV